MATSLQPLKLLCDTNVFIAAVDITPQNTHADAELATRLIELANAGGHRLFRGLAMRRDLERDSEADRKRARTLQARQWEQLRAIPIPPTLAGRAGYRPPLSENDSVDLEMLVALNADAVDILVTQDRRLRNAAARLDLAERVQSLPAAVEYLEQLAGGEVVYPTVDALEAYQLDTDDPIFDSLRGDYDEFDQWFAKARLEHRPCIAIRGAGPMEALAILKDELDRPHGLEGKVLKVCTFKVADHATGAKRGELLLKAIFGTAVTGDHDFIYVEVYPQHDALLRLLEEFGFEVLPGGTTAHEGELVLVKNRRPPPGTDLSPLDYHRLFGPPAVIVDTAFVIPVEPRWHDELFPEAAFQQDLFGPEAPGNALRKAYLCRAVTNQMRPGATVLFYRSHDEHSVRVVGVVEDAQRVADPAAIRRIVGPRTVYSDDDIQGLTAKGPVLVVLFRQDRVLDLAWPLGTLTEQHVLTSHPQSITQVADDRGLEWIRQQLHV